MQNGDANQRQAEGANVNPGQQISLMEISPRTGDVRGRRVLRSSFRRMRGGLAWCTLRIATRRTLWKCRVYFRQESTRLPSDASLSNPTTPQSRQSACRLRAAKRRLG